jgi:hypothetical protein
MVSKKLSVRTEDDLGWKEHAFHTVVVNFSLVGMSYSPWLSHYCRIKIVLPIKS